jgi:hypothetical protein
MSPNDVVSLIGGIVAILATALAVIGWYVRVTVERVVTAHTQSIQPGYKNGGKSLTDVADKLDSIAERLSKLEGK